jgi:hypothetical protein
MEDDFKGLMKQSLLISITHMSRRIKEVREFVVKRKQHLQNLLRLVLSLASNNMSYLVSLKQT